MQLLGDLAHIRTGDKGNTAQVSVIAFRAEEFARLVCHVTAARIRAHLRLADDIVIERYEIASLGALNFVLDGVLRGGVTRSLALDAHGKTIGLQLLDMQIEIEANDGD